LSYSGGESLTGRRGGMARSSPICQLKMGWEKRGKPVFLTAWPRKEKSSEKRGSEYYFERRERRIIHSFKQLARHGWRREERLMLLCRGRRFWGGRGKAAGEDTNSIRRTRRPHPPSLTDRERHGGKRASTLNQEGTGVHATLS